MMSRFPHLPETFILREMNEMVRHGWDVVLYPLIENEQDVVHAEARPWLEQARYIPFFSLAILLVNVKVLFSQPITYGEIWWRTLRESWGSRKLLTRGLAMLPKTVYMAEQMKREGVAHIHAHYATYPALAAWVIFRLTGISYSLTVHAHDIFVETAMLDTKMRHAVFVAAISAFNRAYLAEQLGDWVKERIYVVHCGIMPEQYEARERPWQVGERLEMITTGSLQPYKGQKYLVEACARLREMGVPFRCRVIGGGEERDDLAARIEAHGLQDEVLLLGAKTQDEVAALLGTAHLYVQPSIVTPEGKMEGIPVALMEAMATQLPVLATRLSGIPELVRPGETGYLVPPADADALAEAVRDIYHQPEVAGRLGGHGRELVLREFELRDNVRQLSGLVSRLV